MELDFIDNEFLYEFFFWYFQIVLALILTFWFLKGGIWLMRKFLGK